MKGAFTPKVKELIRGRDGGACFICGGAGSNYHHRLARGAGGSRNPVVGGAANGLLLCGSGTTGCHGVVESNRAVAYENGWLVRRNGVLLPVDVPVFSPFLGGWFLLDNDGGKKVSGNE